MNICKGITVPFKIFQIKNFFFLFFFVCPANPPFFAKRLYWFLIVLFSRRIIYQILVSYLQMFNNFGNLFRVAGKLGLVGYDRFFFHFFFLCALIPVIHRVVECIRLIWEDYSSLTLLLFLWNFFFFFNIRE